MLDPLCETACAERPETRSGWNPQWSTRVPEILLVLNRRPSCSRSRHTVVVLGRQEAPRLGIRKRNRRRVGLADQFRACRRGSFHQVCFQTRPKRTRRVNRLERLQSIWLRRRPAFPSPALGLRNPNRMRVRVDAWMNTNRFRIRPALAYGASRRSATDRSDRRSRSHNAGLLDTPTNVSSGWIETSWQNALPRYWQQFTPPDEGRGETKMGAVVNQFVLGG